MGRPREDNFQVPESVENYTITAMFYNWSLCKWACRAPQIATEILRLMHKNVFIPLWMMQYVCEKSEKKEQTEILEIETLFKQSNFQDDYGKDATKALVEFGKILCQIIHEAGIHKTVKHDDDHKE